MVNVNSFNFLPHCQVWKSVISKTEALSEKIRSQADIIYESTHSKLQTLIADRRAAKQLFQDEKTAFENELNKVSTINNVVGGTVHLK